MLKNLLKFLIVCWLAIGLWRYVFTQTPRGQEYWTKNMSYLKASILESLDGTGVVHTGDAISFSGWEIIWSDTGAIVVTQQVLDQRLNYYRQHKSELRQ